MTRFLRSRAGGGRVDRAAAAGRAPAGGSRAVGQRQVVGGAGWSVARAPNGILPGSESWRTVTLVPGGDPLANLAAALAEPARDNDDDAATTVLVVDQFEETFTLCHDQAAREAFADTLLKLAGDGVIVILTLRTDFLKMWARLPRLQPAFERAQVDSRAHARS